MRITIEVGALGETTPSEYLARFLFGGLVTAATGLIAKEFGPTIGGLFLAFPAIFPATATLTRKHEQEKKEEAGKRGRRRGRYAAAIEAMGTSFGAMGLFFFACFVTELLHYHSPWIVLLGATAVWMTIAALVWRFRKSGAFLKLRRKVRDQLRTAAQ